MQSPSWNDSFVIGIPEVDAEHRELFSVLSGLSAAAEARDIKRSRDLLRQVAEHAAGHFSHEERLMRRAGYSGYHWHRRQHATAAERLGVLLQAARCGGFPEYERLLEFLTSWLPEHITLHDRMMSASVRNYRRLDRRRQTPSRPARPRPR